MGALGRMDFVVEICEEVYLRWDVKLIIKKK